MTIEKDVNFLLLCKLNRFRCILLQVYSMRNLELRKGYNFDSLLQLNVLNWKKPSVVLSLKEFCLLLAGAIDDRKLLSEFLLAVSWSQAITLIWLTNLAFNLKNLSVTLSFNVICKSFLMLPMMTHILVSSF